MLLGSIQYKLVFHKQALSPSMLEDFVTQSVHLVHLYTQYFTDVEFSCFFLHTSHGLLYFILLSFHQCDYVGFF